MSRLRPHGPSFLVACTLGAALAVPAMAAPPTAVSFQPGNAWTQEVGAVSRSQSRQEYSVPVEADNTLQINLVTRDPNVFFKVKSGRDELVDTYKTGATTWSTPTSTAGNYTIQVYVDPNAMARGEQAKYALQIGRYSAKDLRPASTAVSFQPGNPWAQVTGSLDREGVAHDYTVDMAAGRTLAVNLISRNAGVHFKVQDPSGSQVLVDSSQTGATKWSAPVPTAGTYTVDVYVDPATLPAGATAGYALQIGQYESGQVPAGAASAAPPATAAQPAGTD